MWSPDKSGKQSPPQALREWVFLHSPLKEVLPFLHIENLSFRSQMPRRHHVLVLSKNITPSGEEWALIGDSLGVCAFVETQRHKGTELSQRGGDGIE